MAYLGLAAMFVAVALPAAQGAAPVPAPTRARPPQHEPTSLETGARFKCQDGGELTARFASQNARLIAIVDSGDGPHALPVVPWEGGPAKLTWTDGKRTLTWSPGVQIMFMEGAQHRMCGRGEHQH